MNKRDHLKAIYLKHCWSDADRADETIGQLTAQDVEEELAWWDDHMTERERENLGKDR
jgi:hypothetical protein